MLSFESGRYSTARVWPAFIDTTQTRLKNAVMSITLDDRRVNRCNLCHTYLNNWKHAQSLTIAHVFTYSHTGDNQQSITGLVKPKTPQCESWQVMNAVATMEAVACWQYSTNSIEWTVCLHSCTAMKAAVRDIHVE
jgi:hypothetical protein